MDQVFSLPKRFGVQQARIAQGAGIVGPVFCMNGVKFMDILLQFSSGTGEPVLALQQASDRAMSSPTVLQLESVEIAADANVNEVQPWARVADINRSAKVNSYTPVAPYATASNVALVNLRVYAESLGDGMKFVRVNMASLANRDTIITMIGWKDRAGDLDYQPQLAS